MRRRGAGRPPRPARAALCVGGPFVPDAEPNGVMPDGVKKEEQGSRRMRAIAFFAIVVVLLALSYLLPVRAWIDALHERVQSSGPWAPVLWGALYVVASLLLVPGAILTLA